MEKKKEPWKFVEFLWKFGPIFILAVLIKAALISTTVYVWTGSFCVTRWSQCSVRFLHSKIHLISIYQYVSTENNKQKIWED